NLPARRRRHDSSGVVAPVAGALVAVGAAGWRSIAAEPDLYLPTPDQPTQPRLSSAARRLPAVHPAVHRSVCPGAVVGGQHHHPVAGAGRVLRYPGVSNGPGDLRALELYLYQPVHLGARPVLRLALPVRRAAGTGRLAGAEIAPAAVQDSGATSSPAAMD